jgi:cysteine desulfurase / selenocysteine lyase
MSKADFPIFAAHPDLVYLDSAATAQKPASVIEAVNAFSSASYGTIHRGLYGLSVDAGARYEEVRAHAARFIGGKPEEIVFTSGATDGLNLLATVFALEPGDEIIVSELEHHANMLPWRQVPGAVVRYAPVNEAGEIEIERLEALISPRTKVVSLTLCSNVLGTVFPIAAVRNVLDRQGSSAILVVDAAQAAAHFPVSVGELGCDFLVFSGHKLYGPTGTGILWGRYELLASLPPYRVGGDMIRSVSKESVEWAAAPQRFEVGTPNIEGIIGLGAAITYLDGIGMEAVAAHTAAIATYAREQLGKHPRVHVIGNPDPRSGIISFTVDGIHPHDLAQELGDRQICIRAGHHCAAPLHQKLGIPASNRMSLGIYSEKYDIDVFMKAMAEICEVYHA